MQKIKSEIVKEGQIICIKCPRGCYMNYKVFSDGSMEVTGNLCPLGKKYAEEEIRNPMRVIFTTVRIIGARWPRLPVRTEKPIPKSKIFEVINELKDIVVEAPVKKGQIILENVAGTGVNVISERSMEKIG